MDRGPERCTGGGDQKYPQKERFKKAKWWSQEALQIIEGRREVKGKGEGEIYTQLNAEFQRRARKYNKAFLSDQCKEGEENNRMGNTRKLSIPKKLDIPRKYFMKRWAQ